MSLNTTNIRTYMNKRRNEKLRKTLIIYYSNTKIHLKKIVEKPNRYKTSRPTIDGSLGRYLTF